MRARTQLVEMLKKAGFTLLRENNHGIWLCPCGHIKLTVPRTPGKGRSMDNSTGEMNRALRQCAQLRRVA